MKQETKQCQNCNKEFIIDEQDFDFYERIKVPAPTWCPDCRLQRRLCFRNERTLYKRKCDLCNKDIISIYHKDSPCTVYCQQCWWSDKWDPMEYGREIGFSEPFLKQFNQLYNDVPRCGVHNVNSVNSEYCNININIKNCYLVFGGGFNENSLYSNTLIRCKDIIEGCWLNKCQNSGFIIDCDNCYKTFFSQNCQDCIDSWFLYDCRNCENCLFSFNLRNKSYYVHNKQVTKEEFEKTRNSFLGSYKLLEKAISEFNNFKTQALNKYMTGKKNINCSGNFIYNSKNAKNSYFCTEAEDVKNAVKAIEQKDSMDMFGTSFGNLMYESMNADFCSTSKFVVNAEHLVSSFYSTDVKSDEYVFGCVALRNKQYCILNKQYTKEEYMELIPKIIEHMNSLPYKDKKGRLYRYGEFFAPELSPFAYNETIAQEYFPLTKEQAIEQGYIWKEPEHKDIHIDIHELPDNIKDVNDDIIGKVIQCEHKGQCNEQCTKAFKIIAQELEFYKKMNIPLPRLCPNCRHYQRIKQRNPLKLWKRNCDKCNIGIETSYSLDRKEKIYCEECYKKEVI